MFLRSTALVFFADTEPTSSCVRYSSGARAMETRWGYLLERCISKERSCCAVAIGASKIECGTGETKQSSQKSSGTAPTSHRKRDVEEAQLLVVGII